MTLCSLFSLRQGFIEPTLASYLLCSLDDFELMISLISLPMGLQLQTCVITFGQYGNLESKATRDNAQIQGSHLEKPQACFSEMESVLIPKSKRGFNG